MNIQVLLRVHVLNVCYLDVTTWGGVCLPVWVCLKVRVSLKSTTSYLIFRQFSRHQSTKSWLSSLYFCPSQWWCQQWWCCALLPLHWGTTSYLNSSCTIKGEGRRFLSLTRSLFSADDSGGKSCGDSPVKDIYRAIWWCPVFWWLLLVCKVSPGLTAHCMVGPVNLPSLLLSSFQNFLCWNVVKASLGFCPLKINVYLDHCRLAFS